MQFGMVNIPVALYVATESTSKVSFNLLCPDHKSRIKNKRWCPVGEHEVASTVKGFEYEKGQYVIFDENDLEKALADFRSRTRKFGALTRSTGTIG